MLEWLLSLIVLPLHSSVGSIVLWMYVLLLITEASTEGEWVAVLLGDICAGPGGFSEYVIWRKTQAGARKNFKVKGFGFTLKGSNDFKLEDFYAAPPEFFEPHYGELTVFRGLTFLVMLHLWLHFIVMKSSMLHYQNNLKPQSIMGGVIFCLILQGRHNIAVFMQLASTSLTTLSVKRNLSLLQDDAH